MCSPTLDPVNWDRLFEDLEGQLASEWEAERAARDAESERLRIAQLTLRSRLRFLCERQASVIMDLANGRRVPLTLRTVGADWIAADSTTARGGGSAHSMLVIPLHAVHGVSTDHGMILGSLDEQPAPPSALRERMTLGFVLRDLARRRVPLHLSTANAEDIHGTIDRAGSDHLDLALHDAGTARLAGAVQGFRIVPFDAVVSVRTTGDQPL
jgi:hypothetical protein